MRRRRNPDYGQLAMLASIGVGAFVLYKWLTNAGAAAATAVSNTFSNTSSSVADVLQTLFPQKNSVLAPGATILLGDGSEIPASAAAGVGEFTATDGTLEFQFLYNGKVYRTTSITPDDTNTYYATTGS